MDGNLYRSLFNQCGKCRHFSNIYVTCKAFPNGIPNEIWFDKVSHVTPYPGDGGTVFEPFTPEELATITASFSGEGPEEAEVRKSKVYIRSRRDAPGGVKVHKGPHGGLYYWEIKKAAAVTGQPQNAGAVMEDGELRKYVPSEAQVPEGYTPKRGPRGGIYYNPRERKTGEEEEPPKEGGEPEEKEAPGGKPPAPEEELVDLSKVNPEFTDEEVNKLLQKFNRKPAGQGQPIAFDTPEEFKYVLEKSRYGLISAGKNGNNPEHQKLTPEDFKKRHDQLKADLKDAGMMFTEVLGKYGEYEDSFLVMAHDSEKPELISLGEKYGQESIIYVDKGKNELIYTSDTESDGQKIKKGQCVEGDGYISQVSDLQEMFTQADVGGKKARFMLNFNWGSYGQCLGGKPEGEERGPFEEIKDWSAMDMDQRRQVWSQLPLTERDKIADAINSIPAREQEIVKNLPAWRETGNLLNDIRTRVDDATGEIGPWAGPKITSVMDETLKWLKAASQQGGEDLLQFRELAKTATDYLIAQEAEAWTRQLGDHGIHHIRGDIDRTLMALKAIPGDDTAEQIAMVHLAAIFHDAGYMTGPSRMFLDEGHPRWSEQNYRKNLQPMIEKAMGPHAANEIGYMIRTHDASDLNWQEDVIGSAFRLADNTALFEEDKMPPLFRYVPENVDVLIHLSKGAITLDEAKRRMRQNIDNIYYHPMWDNMKARLYQAVDESTTFTPKATLGMLGGKVDNIIWRDDHVVVQLRKNEDMSRLQRVMDLGQRQFGKFAEAYGADPDQFSELLDFTFKDRMGRTVLEAEVIGPGGKGSKPYTMPDMNVDDLQMNVGEKWNPAAHAFDEEYEPSLNERKGKGTIDPHEYNAVTNYCNQDYREINHYLRNKDKPESNPRIKANAEKMLNLAKKSKLGNNYRLFRGITGKWAQAFREQVLNGSIKNLTDQGFTSWTWDKSVAQVFAADLGFQDWSHDMMMVLDAKSGSPGIYVGQHRHESEIILPPGTTFRIRGIQKIAVTGPMKTETEQQIIESKKRPMPQYITMVHVEPVYPEGYQ